MTLNSTSTVLLVLIPLILWRVYSRIRRLVGRQRSTLRRHWIGIMAFSLLSLLFGLGAMRDPLSLAGLAAGLLSGVALAWLGLRLTKFEATREGYFYTPNAHIGIALSLLFIGRVLLRMMRMFGMNDLEVQASAHDFSRSWLTLLCFGLLAGYYVAYAIGMLLWRRRVKAARLREQAPEVQATGGDPG
jgi:hypothetical protein